LFFKPDDVYNLYQVPPQRSIQGVNGVERIKGYRYPAPGSQPFPKVPTRETEDEIYDTNFYARDPRNIQRKVNRLFRRRLKIF
jgi:hypothetical protein